MELGRRALLQALLGGMAASSGSCGRPREPRFGGRLLGQNVTMGHRLRDGLRSDPARLDRVGVVIVGAGVAGLSAAWRLARKGYDDFVVLELEDHPGGTSASGENAVSAFPWGAHYVPTPLTAAGPLVTLLGEVGALEGIDASGRPVVAEELLCRAPQERLFLAGRFREGLFPHYGATREDLRQQRAFELEVARWVALRDERGRRAFTLPSIEGATHPDLDALDRISMDEYLRQRGLTSPRLRWWVEYACRDDYGTLLASTSAYAGIFYFASRVEGPGAKGAEFITWPEGNGRLVRHLAGVAGPRLRTSVVVTDVRPSEAGVEVRAIDGGTGAPLGFAARAVIVAVPQYVARRVVAPLREAQPSDRLPALSYSPWVVANLTLRERPTEANFPLAWDNVIYDSKSLGYVVATHQSGRDHGPSVWTYYLPLLDLPPAEGRARLLTTNWEGWVQVILRDLSRVHPSIAEHLETLDVWRWGHAMVRPTVGLLRGAPLAAARLPLGRIFFANTDLSGMALFEEAQHWGVTAAEGAHALLP